MNIYAIIILFALFFDFISGLIADILNLKNLSGKLPEEFSDVYDAEKYKKSQEYTRANTRFGFLTESLNLAVLLIFWFSGGFNAVDNIARSISSSPVWTGLVFTGILVFFKSILNLPFSIYATFVIEEKFGFNKTTAATFIKDIIKGTLLGILIGGPLLAGIFAFFEYAGTFAWLYCWIAVTLFTLVLQYVAPKWIMPLFNKFKPLDEGELKEKIMEYAKKVNYRLADVTVMDGSKRSSKSNAFFTGFGKNRRIALFDTLIEKHSADELTAVLAHEIGHYKKKHIIKGMITGIIHSGLLFFLLSLFLNQQGLFDAFYMDNVSVYAGMLFFGLLYAPVEMILSIFMTMLSRKHEFQADQFAAETTEHPEWLISALKKLSVDNLSNLRPHPFYVFLNYSHPPVLKRINALRQISV